MWLAIGIIAIILLLIGLYIILVLGLATMVVQKNKEQLDFNKLIAEYRDIVEKQEADINMMSNTILKYKQMVENLQHAVIQSSTDVRQLLKTKTCQRCVKGVKKDGTKCEDCNGTGVANYILDADAKA